MNDFFGRPGKRPAIAADNVILTKRDTRFYVLLVERGTEPYKGKWALPGGFMEWSESCHDAAARELAEETTLKNVDLKFLGVYDKPGRDPRGTVVSIIYFALVDEKKHHPVGGDDAAKADWFPVDDHPDLAFDHGKALTDAMERLSEL